jgi:uncharacterized protein (UPF0332 family)
MSHLRSKSEINLSSAELLHDKSMYASVIHCAYYSCFQFMLYVWYNKMNKTESELTQLNRNTQREGSHEVLINQIGLYFSQNSLENRTFNNLILQLKRMRKNADYMNVMIDFSGYILN